MLKSSNVPFEWTAQCQETVEKLMAALISVPILVMYDTCQELNRHTDASTLGYGVILYLGNIKEKQVLAYSSQTLLPVEKQYPIIEWPHNSQW